MTLDLTTYGSAAAALLGVVALILLLARGARRIGIDGHARPGRRLAIVEALALDHRRRLVLVRCDQTEHLLLLGGEHEIRLEPGRETAP